MNWESPQQMALCLRPKMLRRSHNDSSWRAHVWSASTQLEPSLVGFPVTVSEKQT